MKRAHNLSERPTPNGRPDASDIDVAPTIPCPMLVLLQNVAVDLMVANYIREKALSYLSNAGRSRWIINLN